MRYLSYIKILLSFFFGMLTASIIAIYVFAQGQLLSETMMVLAGAVSNYEMAASQKSQEEIINILNSRISCSLNVVEQVKDTNLPFLSIDESYNHLISKAYQLRQVPCDYSFKLVPNSSEVSPQIE